MTDLDAGYAFNHNTTINFAELFAIRLTLQQIINNMDILQDYNQICIFTDSLATFNLFKMEYYPNLRLYYNELMDIFSLIYIMQNNNWKISFIKVPSHVGIDCNEIVDEKAKNAAGIAVDSQFSETWREDLNPIIADIQYFTSRLKQYYNEKAKREFISLYNAKHNGEDMTHKWKDYIIIESMFDENGIFKNNVGKLWYQEFKRMNYKNVELIMNYENRAHCS